MQTFETLLALLAVNGPMQQVAFKTTRERCKGFWLNGSWYEDRGSVFRAHDVGRAETRTCSGAYPARVVELYRLSVGGVLYGFRFV